MQVSAGWRVKHVVPVLPNAVAPGATNQQLMARSKSRDARNSVPRIIAFEHSQTNGRERAHVHARVKDTGPPARPPDNDTKTKAPPRTQPR